MVSWVDRDRIFSRHSKGLSLEHHLRRGHPARSDQNGTGGKSIEGPGN